MESGWRDAAEDIACQKPRSRRRGATVLGSGAVDRARTTAGRRCSPPRTATSTWRGCCWTKARRSIGRRRTSDAAVHRLRERPRRRGAAVARKVNRAVSRKDAFDIAVERARRRAAREPLAKFSPLTRRDDAARGRLGSSRRPRRRQAMDTRCRRTGENHVDMRIAERRGGRRARRHVDSGCWPSPRRMATSDAARCWTTARRNTTERRSDAAVHRLPGRPRRRGAALLDNGAEVDGRRRTVATPLSSLPERPLGHRRAAGQRARRWTRRRRRRCCTSPGERRRGEVETGGRARTRTARRRWTSPEKNGHVDAARLLLDKGGKGRRGRVHRCRKAALRRCMDRLRRTGRRGESLVPQRRGRSTGLDEARRRRDKAMPEGPSIAAARCCC